VIGPHGLIEYALDKYFTPIPPAPTTTVMALDSIINIVAMIFGGCCANVFALEAIVRYLT